MNSSNRTEAWLRGPLPDIAPELQPLAYTLVQAREDIERVAVAIPPAELWLAPGGAASAGFHLAHAAGALDRLFTYARGESLSAAQRAVLAAETTPGEALDALVLRVLQSIDRALDQLRTTPASSLQESRTIGRAALPTTVLGLLFHGAEHTSRHVGQLTTTAKIVRGLGLAGPEK